MKILEIEIKNIRGIKHIHIKPNAKNLVIFGPNGTGKSAIVDSVDFLLSGRINRLTGKGSKSLKIKEHGCHVDYRDRLKDTVVTAKVKLYGKEMVLERSINKPIHLKVDPQKYEKLVKSHLKVADLGLHILSRREILRFITAEEGERAKEIQELLDLSDIENARTMLVKIENEAESEFKTKESNFGVAKSELTTLLSLVAFSEDECLKKVNELRKGLGGDELKELDSNKIKEGLTPHVFEANKEFLTKEQIENYIKETKTILAQKDELEKKESELKSLLEEIQKEAKLKQSLLYKKLYEAGISLVSEDNVCPLCGRAWTEGDFKAFLEEKKKETEIVKGKQEKVDKLSTEIKTQLDLLHNHVSNLDKAREQFGIKPKEENEDQPNLKQDIKEWSDSMLEPIDKWNNNKWPKIEMSGIFDEGNFDKDYFSILKEALTKSGAKLTKQQKTWEVLIRMSDKWTACKQSQNNRRKAEIYRNRAKVCREYFEKARDSILEGLYDSVEDDFDKYYKTIHSEDEDTFCSELKPDGPSLKFEVDFYERGKFPPHALHSEGHQDSMGLCLFLALNEYLTKNALSIIVLDDVIMSIDHNHRRDICRLIKTHFSDKQLVITTHDTAWAKQLKTEGIVEQKNMIHFLSWDIEVGPSYEWDKDIWDKIAELLKKDDVPGAAQKLRREAECYFENVCDFLSAKITYKGSRQWELGEYASAAVSVLKSLAHSAKKNFEKAGDRNKALEVEKFYENAKKVISRSQVEQWAVNAGIHYNQWADMKRKDFEPVVESFRELFNLFQCPACEGPLLFERSVGKTASRSVSCRCKEISWNVAKR